MSETSLAYTWVATTMQADAPLMAAATGGVFREYAPMDTVPPFALVVQQSSVDVNTMNGTSANGGTVSIGAYSDRKSTRLNSSHTVISYAVFCLKKKKKKNLLGYLVTNKNEDTTYRDIILSSLLNDKYINLV